MWIAKPIQALSKDEAFFYQKMMEEKNSPLAQSLLWGKAIEASNIPVYACYESEKKIGGLAFYYDGNMECVNGPLLNWSQDEINQDLATFVYALHKANKNCKKVILKPRWNKVEEVDNSSHLKFPIHSFEESSTKILDLSQVQDLKQYLGTKIRHEESRSSKYNIHFYTPELTTFYQSLKMDYQEKKEFLPPFSWFETLSENIFLLGASLDDQIVSEILLITHGETCTYLFAREQRKESAPNISLNLRLQSEAIKICLEKGLRFYDLGGYKKDIDSSDGYWGVKNFKDKFPGKIEEFVSPVFIFE